MKTFAGLYTGVGTAAVTIGFGFIPDQVEIFNIGAAEGERLVFNRILQRGIVSYGGRIQTQLGDGNAHEVLLTRANGVKLYDGGTRILTPSVYSLISSNLVAAYQGNMAEKSTVPVRRWTLGNSGNATGNFDVACDTTYVGAGSEIWIRPDTAPDTVVRRTIVAITSNGEEANETTLDQSAPSGNIEKIGYLADFVTCPAGMLLPAGITINDTTYVNASGQKFALVATQWDGRL